jgi:hypothetical protein
VTIAQEVPLAVSKLIPKPQRQEKAGELRVSQAHKNEGERFL